MNSSLVLWVVLLLLNTGRLSAIDQFLQKESETAMVRSDDDMGGPMTHCLLRRCVPNYYYPHNASIWEGDVWDGHAAPPCSLCGASPMHRCAVCGSSSALMRGATTQDEEGLWLAFLCDKCDEKTSQHFAHSSSQQTTTHPVTTPQVRGGKALLRLYEGSMKALLRFYLRSFVQSPHVPRSLPRSRAASPSLCAGV
jgi:hypothetical protein